MQEGPSGKYWVDDIGGGLERVVAEAEVDDDEYSRVMRQLGYAEAGALRGEADTVQPMSPTESYPSAPERDPPPRWAQPWIMLAYIIAWPFAALWRRVFRGKQVPRGGRHGNTDR